MLVFWLILISTNLASAQLWQDGEDKQPKIWVTSDNNLYLESAPDDNIIFRLKNDAFFNINDINIMDILRQYKIDQMELLNATKDTIAEQMSLIDLQHNVKNLYDDLKRFARNLRSVDNSTRLTLNRRIIRRILGRIRRLDQRLTLIEQDLLIDDCSSNEQSSSVCKNGGICYDGFKDFTCDCPKGWTGKDCTEDVNECAQFVGTNLGCQNYAICHNTPGSYRCICKPGFTGTHCLISTQSLTCGSGNSKELCDHGTCVPAKNALGYVCICDDGWSRDPFTNLSSFSSAPCNTDIDECLESRNPCHSGCINLPGGFRCAPCPRGYSGNGLFCSDINECLIDNGGCSLYPKVHCINTEGSFHCGECPLGWTGDGRTCTSVTADSCQNEGICFHLAKCQYVSDTVTCTCPHGMFGHGFGENGCQTQPILDACNNHICKNNGTCVIRGRGTSCLCPVGYSGAMCEIGDICQPNPCQNNGRCKSMGRDRYHCTCTRGTTGKNCEILREICSTTIYQSEGSIRYPMEADLTEYDNNERCVWLMITNYSQIFNVRFNSFDVEESSDCTKDWLQIHDGNSLTSQLIGRYCGKQLPFDGAYFQSSQHYLLFWFHSDNRTQSKGFNITWNSQDYVCGGHINLQYSDTNKDISDNDNNDNNIDVNTNNGGFIRSPGYPGKTPKNRNCDWKIEAPYGYRLVIRIYQVILGSHAETLNPDPDCLNGDSLMIYDAELLLRRFCASDYSESSGVINPPPPIRSSTNNIRIHYHTDRYGTDSIFQLHYHLESNLPHCGGHYTSSSDIIILSTIESVCLYLIEQSSKTIRIELEFLEISKLPFSECTIYNLEIYDGKTLNDPLLLRFCGAEQLTKLTSTNNFLLIRFQHYFNLDKENSAVDNVIPLCKIKYRRVCGENVYGPDSSELSSPNYPSPFISDIHCTYEIYAPMNMIIYANFTDIDLSPNNNNEQGDDNAELSKNLQITTGNDTNRNYLEIVLSDTDVRRYYKASPMLLISHRNRMTIVFHGGMNRELGRGFKVNITFESLNCGGILTAISNETTIDRVVDPPEECEWILEDEHFRLNLLYEPITSGKDESAPSLLIYGSTSDNDPSRHLLYNLTRTRTIFETFNYHRLYIIGSKASYHIKFSFKHINEITNCGGSFRARYGIIKSPFWPNNYPPNTNCEWVLMAPIGYRIKLIIQNFTLEAMNDCKSDALIIRNGLLSNSPLISRYCGNSQIPSSILSFGNYLWIRFESDDSIELSGFYIRWEQTLSGCGGSLSAFKGSILSPLITKLYDQNDNVDLNDPNERMQQCNWLIRISHGSIIRLRYYQIYMSADNPLLGAYNFCEVVKEILEIYDGPNALSNRIIYNCLNNNSSQNEIKLNDDNDEKHDLSVNLITLQSKTNELFIKCNLNQYKIIPEFIIDYEGVCDKRILLNQLQGIIESPNYPDVYPEQIICEWDLKSEQSHHTHWTIHFTFLPINSQLDTNSLTQEDIISDYDYSVEIHDENEDKQTYLQLIDMKGDDILTTSKISRSSINSIQSKGNRLLIKYRINTKHPPLFSWRAEYSRIGCGKKLHRDFGKIATNDIPYGTNLDCQWYIEVMPGKQIYLNIDSVELESDNDCNRNGLRISTDSDKQIKPLLYECSIEKTSMHLMSHGNRLYIHFYTDSKRARKYLQASYHSQWNVCGGVLSLANSGIINSPDYPQFYRLAVSCIWYVSVTDSYGIRFQFDDYNLTSIKSTNNRSTTSGSTCDPKTSLVSLVISELNVSNESKEKPNKDLIFCDQNEFTTSPLYVVSAKVKVKFEIRSPVEPQDENVPLASRQWPGVRFQLSYRKECGGTVRKRYGYLLSNALEQCIWQIPIKKGEILNLNVEELDCHCDKNKAKDDSSNGCRNYLKMEQSALDAVEGFLSSNNSLMYCNQKHIKNLHFYTSTLQIWTRNIKTRLSYSFVENSCGGTFKGAQGSLTSPNYPSTYPSNIECIWEIETNRGNQISIVFEEMKIPTAPYCNEDFLEVRENNSTGRELGLYCSSEPPFDKIVAFEKVWIKFRSVIGSTGQGFKLTWNTLHENEIINMMSGFIEPPPISLPNLKDEEEFDEEDSYRWRILITRGSYVLLTFKQYNSGLKLFDGFNEEALEIAIMEAPWSFVSSSNVLYLMTNNPELEYFLLEWKSIDNKLDYNSSDSSDNDGNIVWNKNCSKTFKLTGREEAVKLTSPGYPENYPDNIHCRWIFESLQKTEHIVMSLNHLDLEAISVTAISSTTTTTTGLCSNDYLQFYMSKDLKEWHLIKEICNITQLEQKLSNSYPLIHGGPHLMVQFHTDYSLNQGGFRAFVGAKCGNNLTDSDGSIYNSRHWYYPIDTKCEWQIQVDYGFRIKIQIKFYNDNIKNNSLTNFNKNCYNYILIYDGLDDHGALMPPGKLCYENQQTLHLNADNTVTYESTTNYLYIKFNLKPLSVLEPMSLSKKMKKGSLLNRNNSNDKDNSTKLNDPVDHYLWSVHYYQYSICNNNYRLTDDFNTINITTPNYPNLPQPFTDCKWLFIAPIDKTLRVQFDRKFSLNTRYCSTEVFSSSSTTLLEEYVQLFDGSSILAKSLGKYCHRPDILETSNNILLIHYKTNVPEPNPGFMAQITLNSCGRSFHDYSGYITSPGYPKPNSYLLYQHCDYYINVPTYNSIRITIKYLQLPYQGEELSKQISSKTSTEREVLNDIGADLNIDHVSITPLKGNREQFNQTIFLFGNYSYGSKDNATYEFDTNRVHIRYRTFAPLINQSNVYAGFELFYTRFSVQWQCNRDFKGLSDEVTIRFSRILLHNSVCRWRITVPKPQRVLLEFLNMDEFVGGQRTRYPTFEIYNDHELLSPLTRFSANQYNTSIRLESTDNLMLIRLTLPHGLMSLRPLRIRYSSQSKSICPMDISEEDHEGSIQIQSIEQRAPLSDNLYCRWRFGNIANTDNTFIWTVTNFQCGESLHCNGTYLKIRDDTGFTVFRENLKKVILFTQTSRSRSTSPLSGIITLTSSKEQMVNLVMSYKRYDCGGYYRLQSSDVITIRYPQKNFQISATERDRESLNVRDGEALYCLWSIQKYSRFLNDRRDGNSIMSHYDIKANFTFVEDCETEQLIISPTYLRQRSTMLLPSLSEGNPLLLPLSNEIVICRDNSSQFPFKYNLDKYMTHILYRRSNYKHRSLTKFQLNIIQTMACGTMMKVIQQTPSISVTRSNYVNNLECVWEFKTIFGFALKLQFQDRFFIEDSINCTKDYLAVEILKEEYPLFTVNNNLLNDNDDGLWHEIARYCGRRLPLSLNTTAHRMRLVFRTDNSTIGDGFTFRVMANCEISFNITNQRQIITNPIIYSPTYSNVLKSCEYSFHVPLSSNNAQSSNEEKNKDLFSIRLYRKVNNRSIDTEMIDFDSRDNKICSNDVNSINYKVYRLTADNENLDNMIAVEDPSTSDEYFVEERCFRDYDKLYSYNYLRLSFSMHGIYDNSNNYDNTDQILSSSRHSALRYYLEFQFEYCGGNITYPSSAIIQSQPHITGSEYMHNMNCVWHIKSPHDYNILIRFIYFDMENKFDHVSIYSDHRIDPKQRIAYYTGTYSPPNLPKLLIDYNEATIVAVSDQNVGGKGFRATVHFIKNCNEKIILPKLDYNHTITVSRDYQLESNQTLNDVESRSAAGEISEYYCQFHIQSPLGYRIRSRFKRLQLNRNNSECQLSCDLKSKHCNQIAIHDGSLITATPMAIYCADFLLSSNLNSNNHKLETISSFNSLIIEFNGGFSPGVYSFEFTLGLETSKCENLDMIQDLDKIESYRLVYPLNAKDAQLSTANQSNIAYPKNAHCIWHLSSSIAVRLNINYFKLQNASQVSGQCLDYLQLRGKHQSIYLCGELNNFALGVLSGWGQNIDVIFHSDQTIQERGFDIIFTQKIECNRTYNKLNDILQYNHFLIKKDNDTNQSSQSAMFCRDTIEVPSNYRITIYTYVILKNFNCSTSFLKITDLDQNDTAIYKRCRNAYEYKQINTDSHRIQVEVRNFSNVKLFYIANDRNLSAGCGGHLYSTWGVIMNPIDDYNQRKYSNCRWNIQVPAMNQIQLHFKQFDMGTISNCPWDNIKVYDILDDDSEVLRNTYCGGDHPAAFTSSTHRMAVIAQKSPNFDGSGWILLYNIVNLQYKQFIEENNLS